MDAGSFALPRPGDLPRSRVPQWLDTSPKRRGIRARHSRSRQRSAGGLTGGPVASLCSHALFVRHTVLARDLLRGGEIDSLEDHGVRLERLDGGRQPPKARRAPVADDAVVGAERY